MKIETVVENLREIKDIFDIIGINYWLDTGTLLGAVRDGKIIEWDNDVDLGAWYDDDIKQIISAFPEFNRRGFNLGIKGKFFGIRARRSGCNIDVELYRKRSDYAWSAWIIRKNSIERAFYLYINNMMRARNMNRLNQRTYMESERTIIKKSAIIQKSAYFLSLFPLKLKQLLAYMMLLVLDRRGCIVPIVIPKRYFEKLSTIQFYGMKFNTPSNVEEYLEYRYGGNWKIPTKKWIFWKDDGSINLNWSALVSQS